MNTQDWIRSDNFIDNCTDENYALAKEIYNYFDTRLLGGINDPDILEYYNFFKPFNDDYNNAYKLWSSLNSSSPANTVGVKQQTERLRGTDIQKWDVAIQAIYPRDTSMYKTLLPHFRKPFQNGSIESKISALKNLIEAIGDDVKLATVKLDVENFLSSLTLAIENQENQFIQIEFATNNLEAKRLAAAEGMMYVYGKLISKFYKNLRMIDYYFPIELLQRVMQDLFMATLKNDKVRVLFKRTLDIDNNTLQVKHLGENTVIGYFTNGLTNKLEERGLFVSFPPNSLNVYQLADMGYSSQMHHFHIVQQGIGTAVVTVQIC